MDSSKYRGKPKLEVLACAEDLAVAVIGLLQKTRSGVFADQMGRSALSISSNIAEGMSKGTNRDTLKFLFIARGSLSELRSQIRVISKLDSSGWDLVLLKADTTARLLGGLIRKRIERLRRGG
jgi:four helix bundle protein